MQRLSQVLDALGDQINHKLDATSCKLLYNRKQLDLTLPVRFANIPSGSTLELQSGGLLRDGRPKRFPRHIFSF